LKANGFTASYWGPEVEFFVFEKVSCDALNPYRGQAYYISSREASWNSEFQAGYPIRFKDGYFAPPPQDTLLELRNECVGILEECFGILCDAHHHHEVATAGLDGIKKKIDPGDLVDENIYLLTPERRRALGIKELPASLKEAVEELQSDMEYLKPIFTDEVLEKYVEIIMEGTSR
jgi:glutamine synthetase